MRATRFVVLLVAGLISDVSHAAPSYKDVLIEGVPHVRQKPDFCGEACAEMQFRKLGHAITQDQVFEASGLDPVSGRRCYTPELKAALRRLGVRTGEVWYRIDPAYLAGQIEEQWRALHDDLLRGIPSIVCMHYSDRPDTTEHFWLVLGYRAAEDEVVFHEPAEDEGAYRRMPRREFLKLWPLADASGKATIIRLRFEPGKIVAPAATNGFSNADYAQHIMQLKKKLSARKEFTIIVQPPFVVVGDERAEMVRRRATETVKFAVDRLKRDFFSKDPDEILDIWLFKDKKSYERNVKKLFSTETTTPFGYFSTTHKALIMNIETGGGTLVHEIVHPFIRANFPECPAWLNEGLGSLYEQCEDRGGHLQGRTNWRLAGLQEAIRQGGVPSFESLTGMDNEAFYEKDRGTNYSQSRYLCYYLQERGLLVKFYREFLATRVADPTGYKTLQGVLGEVDMDAFKAKWEKFVLKLTFP